MCEHLGISVLIGKRVKGDDESTIKKPPLFCNHAPGFKDFLIFTNNINNFKVFSRQTLKVVNEYVNTLHSKQTFYLKEVTNKSYFSKIK